MLLLGLVVLALIVPFLIAYAMVIGGTTGRTRRIVAVGGGVALSLLAALATTLIVVHGFDGMQ
jgi:hypothetical protein